MSSPLPSPPINPRTGRLEALAVDDGGAGLVVLLLGDPHGLEGGEGGEDGSSDPDGVLALRGGHDLDLDGGGGEGGDLLGHALGDAGEHGGTSGEDDVGVKVLADVDVALHDGLEGGVGDAVHLEAGEVGLEEDLRATEALVADDDDVAVGELEGLLEGGGLGGLLHLLLEVDGDEAQGLLDVAHDLALGGGGEGVTTLGEDLHEVVGEVAAGKVETDDGVGEGVSLVDGDGVGDSVSGIEDAAGGTSGGVQGEDGLDVDVHGRDVEGLEHDLRHALAVRLRVERRLGEEDRVLLRRDAELVVEGVVPDLLHVVPVGDDSVLDGVLQGEDTSLGLGLVTDVGIALLHADHDTGLAGAADEGGEDGAGGVVSGESGCAFGAGAGKGAGKGGTEGRGGEKARERISHVGTGGNLELGKIKSIRSCICLCSRLPAGGKAASRSTSPARSRLTSSAAGPFWPRSPSPHRRPPPLGTAARDRGEVGTGTGRGGAGIRSQGPKLPRKKGSCIEKQRETMRPRPARYACPRPPAAERPSLSPDSLLARLVGTYPCTFRNHCR